MIEILKEEMGSYDYVCGYRIFKLDDTEMFDFVQKLYTDNNKWGKKGVFSDVIINRCQLKDILDFIGIDKEDFKKTLNNDFQDTVGLEDIIGSLKSSMLMKVSLPHRTILVDRGCKKDFRGYKDTFYPVSVTVKPNEYSDFSRYFMDFYDYEEKAVDEAYKVLTESNYPADLNDKDGFEKALITNIETRSELGLV